jgi:hypothetical protein
MTGYSSGLIVLLLGAMVLSAMALAGYHLFIRIMKKGKVNQDRILESILVLYLFLFILVYGIGSYQVMDPDNPFSWRYLTPLFPVVMALVCRLLASIPARGGWLLLIPLLVMGLADTRPFDAFDRIRWKARRGALVHQFTRQRGDQLSIFVRVNLPRHWQGRWDRGKDRIAVFREALESVSRLGPAWKETGYEVLGAWAFENVGLQGTFDLLAEMGSEEKGWEEQILIGVGKEAVECATGGTPTEGKAEPCRLYEVVQDDHWISTFFDKAEERSPELSTAFVRGVGYGLMYDYYNKKGSPMPKPGKRLTLTPLSASILALVRELNEKRIEEGKENLMPHLVQGAGRFLGEACLMNYWAPIDSPEGVMEILGLSKNEELMAAYQDGFVHGLSVFYLNQFNRIDLKEWKFLSAKRFQDMEPYLAKRGIMARPVDGKAGVYKLEEKSR